MDRGPKPSATPSRLQRPSGRLERKGPWPAFGAAIPRRVTRVTLPAEADIAEAMAVFETHPFRRLPLIEDGRVVGMITVDDLVVDAVADFTRLLRPVLGQVLFGHPEPKALVPGR